jgi:LysR family transcriptional regulator, cell division regulator
MNTQDLKIFEAVAANGSFTKAAEVMFTVQSNVTARIKNLEDEFGAELFTRTTRKVQLTSAGETLMQYHKKISHLIDEAKRDIQNAGQIIGSLKVGCIDTTMALKAPEIINLFAEKYPDVELEFKSAMRTALINDVLNYKLDAAFVSAPVNMPELEQIHIKDEQLVILAPAKYTKLTDVTTKHPLTIIVFDQGCIFRARLETWLGSKGIIQYKPIVLNSIEGIINFVESGLGISILPAEIISQYYAGRAINTFAMGKNLGTMTTVLIYRKNVPASRQLEAFIELYEQ